jgi:hypothetical protein
MLCRVRRHWLRAIVILGATAFGGLPGVLQASPPGLQAQDELELIESTEREEDPLGIDESTGRGLEEAARSLRVEEAPKPNAHKGAVLSAISGVRETRHALRVRLSRGLAFVEAELAFENTSAHAAELAYRLAVPEDAVVTELEVCVASRCRSAASKASPKDRAKGSGQVSDQPYVALEKIHDADGSALSLIAGPVAAPGLSLRVVYLAEAPIRGGQIRFVLPARGLDPNTTPASLAVEAEHASPLWPTGVVTLEPALSHEIRAAFAPPEPQLRLEDRGTLGRTRYLRRFEAARAAPASARATWLLLDASPSMEGPARSRVPETLAALLAGLPDKTPVRAFAFAARSVALGELEAASLSLQTLDAALMLDLGAATRPSSVLEGHATLLRREKPRVWILSDGAFDPTQEEQRALTRAAQTGAELWLLLLSDARPAPMLARLFASGGVLHITERADRAMTRGDLDALVEQVAPALRPRTRSNVRAGEQRVTETRLEGALPPDAPWLARWLMRDTRPHPSLVAGVRGESPEAPLIAALPYLSSPPPAPLAQTSMPKESVLAALRNQLIPKARACLRADRRGRADYAIGVTFDFLIARREVLDASIHGVVGPSLRACLRELLAELRLPWFTGQIRVRYPIHTEREALPPVIELEPELGQRIERALSSAPR